MLIRRQLLVLVATGAIVVPAGAQQRPKVMRIGYLDTSSAGIAGARLDRLRSGLRDLGYVEGKNIVIEARWAETHYERLPVLAAELLEGHPDVLVAAGPAAIQVVHRATAKVPVVIVASGDPVSFGVVPSLARPGGNITGVSTNNVDVSYKYVDILREAIPGLSTVVVLMNPGHPGHPNYLKGMQSTAPRTVRIMPVEASTPLEIEAALRLSKEDRADALVVPGDGLFFAEAGRIAELAAKQRLPTLFSSREPVLAGGLMSYGPILSDQFYRAATYVDKILKGANPGDLPIEQPTTFELVINLRTARAIGLTLRQELLLRADALLD